jgi:hypothetical protein
MADLLIAQDGAAFLTEDGRLMALQSDSGVASGARVTLVADQARYDVGDVVFCTATFVDRDGEPIDPTIVSFVWRLFDGTETTFTYGDDAAVDLDNVGIYTFTSPEITQAGKHVCRVDGTEPYAAAERPIPVRTSSFANP